LFYDTISWKSLNIFFSECLLLKSIKKNTVWTCLVPTKVIYSNKVIFYSQPRQKRACSINEGKGFLRWDSCCYIIAEGRESWDRFHSYCPVVMGVWVMAYCQGGRLGLRYGWDYYIGAILEMYCKLGPWYFAVVVVCLIMRQLYSYSLLH